jgi:hypothetical protein
VKRAACCIEWVTMTTVKFSRSSSINSSTLAVAMGSSAEHGSSISKHFGRGRDGARDAQALLLPAGQAGARFIQTILDLFEQASLLQGCHDDSSRSVLLSASP